MFMRAVRSRLLFEQMKGRGVRVISKDDLRTVTADARVKDRFVIVDCIGLCESDLVETHSLEKKPSVPMKGLLDAVGFGSTDPEIVSTLAGRLARLARTLDKPALERLGKMAGVALPELVAGMVEALDSDRQLQAARNAADLPEGAQASPAQVKVHGRAARVAAAHQGPGGHELQDRAGRLRRRAVQPKGWVGQGVQGVRDGAGWAPGRAE
ncbi:MAG TPA: hypothetical protein VEU50_31660 [Archangium sp.]|nr:hypothetical protein [Archangium sp.]HYO57348.1 hypothetical protein [Archangium sp.]